MVSQSEEEAIELKCPKGVIFLFFSFFFLFSFFFFKWTLLAHSSDKILTVFLMWAYELEIAQAHVHHVGFFS